MGIQQPGRGGGIQGKGVSPRCGQGGRLVSLDSIGSNHGKLRWNPIFNSQKSQASFYIAGVTRDASGVAIGGVTVDLYSESRIWINRTISDGSGNYRFDNVGTGSVFLIGYKIGSPDLFGTTIFDETPPSVGYVDDVDIYLGNPATPTTAPNAFIFLA